MNYPVSKPFCQQNPKLSFIELKVHYALKILMTRYGHSYASQTKIGFMAGVTRETANRIIGMLHLQEYIYKIYRGVKRTCLYYAQWPVLRKSFCTIFPYQRELNHTTKDKEYQVALGSLREPVNKSVVSIDGGAVKNSSRAYQWFKSTCQIENTFEAYILRAIAEKYGCGYCQIAIELSQVPYKFCECGIMSRAAPFLFHA